MNTAQERISPLERAKRIAQQKGWNEPTESEKNEIDDLVRLFTNLN